MKKLTINPSNKRYYSNEYINGWGDGVKAQYEATKDYVKVVRCKDCKWYQGVHGVQGHAPCEWFNKQVLWSDFCSNGELYKGGDTE